MPLSDHVPPHSFPPKKDVSCQTTTPQTVILSDRPFLPEVEGPQSHAQRASRFDPTPKYIYFGLDVIIAMVERAMARAAVQHGN